MSGRGGARHAAKPWVDMGILYKCLEKHKVLVADMGSYEHLNSQAAPNAKALLSLKPLWGGLLELSPCGSIHSQPLRQALISLLAQEPDLNTGKHSGAIWANLKIERFNCMMKHVRQLGRNKNALGPAVCQLTRLEYQSLQEGLEKLETSTAPKKDKEEDAEAEEKEEEEEEAEEMPGKVKRKLQPHYSDVSLDSSGVPAIFQSPLGKEGEQQGLKKPAASLQPASTRRPGSRLQEAMGYGLEKPKPKPKPKPKDATGMKRPAAHVLERGTQPGKRQRWESLNQTHGSKPERAYIQGHVKGGAKHLIVQVTATQSPHYLAIIGKIRTALEKDSLTKEEALKMRADLLARYGSK